MKRSRSVGAYTGVKPYVYQNLAEFLATGVRSGIHTFHEQGRLIDLLHEEREGDVLLVVFPAALSQNGVTTPYFSGRGLSERCGFSILSIADPAHSIDGRPTTNWTMGDSTYPFHRDVPAIIRHVAAGKRIIFFGASAGGFPALHYGSLFPESLSLVLNPRTNVFVPPTQIQYSHQSLFPGILKSEIADFIPTEIGRSVNHVLYQQNARDYRYYTSHMLPYIMRNEGNERVYWQFTSWGDGHVAAPPWESARTLSSLASASDWKSGLEGVGGSPMSNASEVVLAHADIGLELPEPR